jgi:hypothetical protein
LPDLVSYEEILVRRAYAGQRIGIASFSAYGLILLVTGDCRIVEHAVPAGAELRLMWTDARTETVHLLLEHPSWPEWDGTGPMPYLEPTVIETLARKTT